MQLAIFQSILLYSPHYGSAKASKSQPQNQRTITEDPKASPKRHRCWNLEGPHFTTQSEKAFWATFSHSLNPERNRFQAVALKRFFRCLWPLLGLLRAILGWVSSKIFGFFSFSVLLGISFVLETNSLVIMNPKNDRIVFQPGIHLPAKIARIRRYDQYGWYFFQYETGVYLYRCTNRLQYIPANTVRYWLPWFLDE